MTYPPSGQDFPDAQPWPGEQPAFGPGYAAGPSYPAMGVYQAQPGSQQPAGYGPVPNPAGYQSVPGYPAGSYPQPGYQQPGYQQTGYQQGPYQQGPGYPMQPGYLPGYPVPNAPTSSNAKWWLIGGLSVLIVLGLVLGGVLWSTHAGDPSTSTAQSGGFTDAGSTDEGQIRRLLSNLGSDGTDIMQSMRDHSCAKDQQLYEKIGTLGPLKPPSTGPGQNSGPTTISDIEVTGNKATAQLTTGSSSRPPLTIYFRKESGDWKICMSDSPLFSKILGGN